MIGRPRGSAPRPGKELFAKLLSLLARDTEPAPEAVRPMTVEAVEAGAETDRREFESRLAAIVGQRGSAVSGRVHVVNLDRVRERLGERWPLVAEKAHLLIRKIIAHRLSGTDYFTPYKDTAYIIVFERLSEAEARLKCSLIAEEIMSKLLGEDQAMSAVDVRSVVARVDGSIELQSMDRLGTLDVLFEQAEAQLMADRAKARLQADHNLDRELASVEEQLRHWQATQPRPERVDDDRQKLGVLMKLLRDTRAGLAAEPPRGNGPEPAFHAEEDLDRVQRRKRVDSLLDQVRAELARREHRAAAEEDTAQAEAEPRLAFGYRPIWQVGLGVINANLCQMTLEIGSERLVGEALLPHEPEPALIANLDRLVLLRGLADVQAGIAAARRSIMIIPVHSATLVSMAGRREYFELCNGIAAQMRPLISFEVFGCQLGGWNAHVLSFIGALKNFGRAVLLRVGLDDTRFDDLATLGVYAVGVDLAAEPETAEVELLPKMERFAGRAARHGMKTFVGGVATRSLVTAAVCHGFDHLSGDAIAAMNGSPAAIHPFKFEDVFLSGPRRNGAAPAPETAAARSSGTKRR